MNVIDDLTQWVMKTADRDLDEHIVRNAVHNIVAVLANRTRRHILVGGNKLLLNYFGIVVAGSNFGKGHIEAKLSNLVDKNMYESNIKRLIELHSVGVGLDIPDIQRFTTTFTTPTKESTTQGIHKITEGLQQASIVGSLNFTNNEFFSTTNSDILTQLLNGYDGNYPKPNIKGSDTSKYIDVKGVPTNIIGYSAIGPLLSDNQAFKQFASLMETGWFRRTWMTTDRYHKKRGKDAEEYFLSASTYDFIEQKDEKTLAMLNPEIVLSDELKPVFSEYRKDIISCTKGIEYEDYKDAYKVIRLAALVAISDNRTVIEIEDFEYAKEFEEYCHQEAAEMLSLKDDFVLGFMLMTKKEMTKTELIKAGVVKQNISVKAFDEFLLNVSEYAHIKGYQLQTIKDPSITMYKVDLMNQVDATKVGLSVSDKLGEGYVFHKDDFSKIPDVLRAKGLNYSAGNFKDGKRNKDSYIPGQDLIILDVDEGMTVDQAKQLFAEYKCIIATTKSHQIEKNGVVCDRFRVILVAEQEIKMSADVYFDFMINVYSYLGQTFDRACADASRMYFSFPGSEVWTSEGTKLFDIRPCVPNTEEEKASARIVEKFSSESSAGSRAQVFFALEAGKGNRNNMLFRYSMMRLDDGADKEEIREELLELNSKLDEPLNENEIERTIIKSLMSK